MTLGKQFENTYWHGDDGTTHFSLKHKYSEGNPDEEFQYPPSNPALETDTPYISDESKESLSSQLSSISEGFDEKPALQGMLFSPYTGTGLRQDPLVHPAVRMHAVKEVLGQNPRGLASSGSRYDGLDRGLTDEDFREHKKRGEELVNALYESDIPIHELNDLKGHDFVATFEPSRDMGDAYGSFSDNDHRIRIRQNLSNLSTSISPSTTGTPLANTLLHEYGHARDITYSESSSKGRNNRVLNDADPIEEGMADAYSEKYSKYAGKLESGRQAFEPWSVPHTGYGTGHTSWERKSSDGIRDFRSPIKSNTASALYAATRLISARSDRGMASIPKHLDGGNEEKILAHLWEHHPEIHSTMNAIPQPGPPREPEYTFSLGDHAAQIHAKHFDTQASRREAFGKALESKRRLEAHERPPTPSAKYDVPLPLEGI